MPTVRNKDIGSWNMSLKMNETFNKRYTGFPVQVGTLPVQLGQSWQLWSNISIYLVKGGPYTDTPLTEWQTTEYITFPQLR